MRNTMIMVIWIVVVGVVVGVVVAVMKPTPDAPPLALKPTPDAPPLALKPTPLVCEGSINLGGPFRCDWVSVLRDVPTGQRFLIVADGVDSGRVVILIPGTVRAEDKGPRP